MPLPVIMSNKSSIEWTESTWNSITGCSKIRLLAMTIPEKPTSSKQRYVTTETGKEA